MTVLASVCVSAHVELQQLFLSSYRPYFFIQGLSLGYKISNQPTWPAKSSWGEGEVGMVEPWDLSPILMFVWEALYQRNYLPSP